MKNSILAIGIMLITNFAYSQSTNNTKSKSVLLITSAQVDLLSERGKAWGFTQESVEKNKVRENLIKVIKEARKKNIPIIHSPVGFPYEKMKDYEPLNAFQNVIVTNQLLAMNTPGVDFITEAKPMKGDIVLPFRQGFSSFWAKSIQEHLKKLNIETVYIVGMLAEGCVQSHARDAAENGYKTIVISDAIGSTSIELLEASYKTLALHTAGVITTKDFLKCE